MAEETQIETPSASKIELPGRGRRQVKIGTVVSNKMTQTVVVKVEKLITDLEAQDIADRRGVARTCCADQDVSRNAPNVVPARNKAPPSAQPRSTPPGSQSWIGLPSGSLSLPKRPLG